MQIVDHTEHGCLVCEDGQESESRHPNCERVDACRLAEAEGALHGHSLSVGEGSEKLGGPAEQLSQPGERELGLRGDTARTQHLHPVGHIDSGLTERRLPDTRVSAKQKSLAPAGTGGGDQRFESRQLRFPADEHTPS